MIRVNVMDNRGACLNAGIRRRKITKYWTIILQETMVLDKDSLLVVYRLQKQFIRECCNHILSHP